MRITLLFVSTFLFLGVGLSQTVENTVLHNEIKEAPEHKSVRQINRIQSSTNRSTIAQKINFVDMTASYYSSTPDYDYYYLFPDTSVHAEYGTSLGIPFIHSFGMTFDLSSEVINAGVGGLLDGFDINAVTYIDTIATYGM
jgi:hypothetical protein